MAINKDLQIYKQTQEFQTILKKSKNRIEKIERQIDDTYIKGLADNQLTKNEFDVKDRWVKDLNWIMGEIKHKKGKELLKFYENRLKNANLFLYQPINAQGMSNSILRYTNLDILRFERGHLYGIENSIDGLIGADKKEEKADGAF